MKRISAFMFLGLAVLNCNAATQEAMSTDFPEDFGQRAMNQMLALVQFGPRVAGSVTEQDVASYLRDQFKKEGLNTWIEPFEFENFMIKESSLEFCALEVTPTMIGFNPYDGLSPINASPVLVQTESGADELAKLQLEDQLVVTTDPAPFFTLMYARPRAIVYLEAEEYASLAGEKCSSARLRVDGDLEKYSSANVVATVGSAGPEAREIIMAAHYDSYRDSPGADDNGSGLGVLLELARYFMKRGVPSDLRLRFVAFGAEELGVVGSRAYLDTHLEDLAKCVLFINLDQVGGPEGPYVEMTGGVSGANDTLIQNHFPAVFRNRAWEATDGQWKLIDLRVVELFTVSNRPAWLRDLIAESAAAIDCEVIPRGNMGGDQQVFTQAGIVSTSIGTSGNTYHSPEDKPAQVVQSQLSVVGRLAAEIACRAMEKIIRDKSDNN